MLWVIYNPYFGTHHTTPEEWSQIAMAARKLGFERIVTLAKVKGQIKKSTEVVHKVGDFEANKGVML